MVERNAFDQGGVLEYNAAVQKAKDTKEPFHFGDIIELCHIKNSQLSIGQQSYKGRCVFGGHDIRDEDGFLAVLSEQGTSASFQSAMKMMHAVGMVCGNTFEIADACSAYLQSFFSNDFPKTYVRLP